MEELILVVDSDFEIDDEDDQDDADIFKKTDHEKQSNIITSNININNSNNNLKINPQLDIKFSNDNSMIKEAEDIIIHEKMHDHADNISEVPVMEESFNDSKSIKHLEGIIKGESNDKNSYNSRGINLNVNLNNNTKSNNSSPQKDIKNVKIDDNTNMMVESNSKNKFK